MILTQPVFALGLAHALPVQQLVPRNTLQLRTGKPQVKFASEKKNQKKSTTDVDADVVRCKQCIARSKSYLGLHLYALKTL